MRFRRQSFTATLGRHGRLDGLLALAIALGGVLPAVAAEWVARPLAEIAVYPEFRVQARVVPADEARLAAEVSGRVVRLPARVGEQVAQGAVVVELDASGYRIDVARAEAQVSLVANRIRLAQSQLAQSEALAARGFVSPEGLRIRQTELAVLRSEAQAARESLAAARLALARTGLRAPFAGVVKDRVASVGDLATPGTPLVTLTALGDPELRALVPVDQVPALRASKPELVVGEQTVSVTVKRVSPLVDRPSQAQEVVFLAEGMLPPGLAGEVRWRSPSPWLPASHLQQRGGKLGAYVERDGKPVFVPLPGAQTGRPAAVDWGLEARVVDAGRQALGLAPEGASK
ncbi:MAG: efflux RND transporter periplasmic adaptor subunit [Zoogloeaceae bacterium]|nr:efflux RND transporter periplasmic adaptor subunit [Zoogloeaceae bacterium]